MQKYSQKFITHVKRSGYEEKSKENMFLHVLAANPPNLMKKEQKQNKLQPFIDNHLSKCKLRKNFFFIFWEMSVSTWGWIRN